MVQEAQPLLDDVFHALANPARRAMLGRLAAGERNITDLAAPLRMSFAAVSKHLRVLENAKLVRRRVEGRAHLLRLEPAPLAAADAWLATYKAFWTHQLDVLDDVLRSRAKPAKKARRKSP